MVPEMMAMFGEFGELQQQMWGGPIKQSEYNALADKHWDYTILHGLECIHWETPFC